MNKKIVEILFDEEESFTKMVSFVKEPAIVSNFLHFSTASNTSLNFSINEEKREVIGAFMIPDVLIPRTEDTDVFFSKETIRKHAMKFMRDGMMHHLNMHHTAKKADSYVFQSFIVDSKAGVRAPDSLNLPDGTWVCGTKILSDELWKDIKTGDVKGFSIELSGMVLDNKTDEVKVQKTPDEELDKVYQRLKYYISATTK